MARPSVQQMSWFAPTCHHCHSPSTTTRFDVVVADGPSFVFGVGWLCDVCHGRTLELCSVGPRELTPDSCLNCGASRVNASGQLVSACRKCGAEHDEIVARVREHCGLPPLAAKMRALGDRGLYRVAFDAVHLRLAAESADIEALATKAKLLIDVHRPEQAVPLLRRVIVFGGPDQISTPIQRGAKIDIALANSGQHQITRRSRRGSSRPMAGPSTRIALSCYSNSGADATRSRRSTPAW
jgi:hypothetical protein